MAEERDRVDHVAVVVADIDRAVEWYTSHLNCEVAYKDASWALLKFANVSLALVLPGQHPAHFGVLREDIERFGEVMVHRDGVKYVYLQDADSNTVEIVKRS